MCGIAGIVAPSNAPRPDPGLVVAMTAAQGHRGPDDAGVEVVHDHDPSVVFGHRRLSIIDLSAAGHQPMHDPETGVWITFNGEIYNYRELRRELEARACSFTTATD